MATFQKFKAEHWNKLVSIVAIEGRGEKGADKLTDYFLKNVGTDYFNEVEFEKGAFEEEDILDWEHKEKIDTFYLVPFRKDTISNSSGSWSYKNTKGCLMPRSLEGIRDAILYAKERQWKITPVASKHSFSNILKTEGCYIDLSICDTDEEDNYENHLEPDYPNDNKFLKKF